MISLLDTHYSRWLKSKYVNQLAMASMQCEHTSCLTVTVMPEGEKKLGAGQE